MRSVLLVALVWLAAIACSGGSDSGISQTDQPTGCPQFAPQSPNTHTIRILKVGGTTATLIVQLADRPTERGTGLMNRECLPEDSGMLFAFPADTTTSFFMRDTVIPLSIAFIQADGEIVHIEDMQPNTTDNHVSPTPYRYAIEMSQGWFAENGVAIGDTADIAESFSASATN
jgi:uncharacterized membrane protein (UPF0127 family)